MSKDSLRNAPWRPMFYWRWEDGSTMNVFISGTIAPSDACDVLEKLIALKRQEQETRGGVEGHTE